MKQFQYIAFITFIYVPDYHFQLYTSQNFFWNPHSQSNVQSYDFRSWWAKNAKKCKSLFSIITKLYFCHNNSLGYLCQVINQPFFKFRNLSSWVTTGFCRFSFLMGLILCAKTFSWKTSTKIPINNYSHVEAFAIGFHFLLLALDYWCLDRQKDHELLAILIFRKLQSQFAFQSPARALVLRSNHTKIDFWRRMQVNEQCLGVLRW